MALNYFSAGTVNVGDTATSTVDSSALVTKIQTVTGGDTYFDTTSELGKVYVYYTHEDGRQMKKIIHNGPAFTGTTSWSAIARDGTWQKTRIKAFDADGAIVFLNRSDIGASEDLTKSGSVITLNT